MGSHTLPISDDICSSSILCWFARCTGSWATLHPAPHVRPPARSAPAIPFIPVRHRKPVVLLPSYTFIRPALSFILSRFHLAYSLPARLTSPGLALDPYANDGRIVLFYLTPTLTLTRSPPCFTIIVPLSTLALLLPCHLPRIHLTSSQFIHSIPTFRFTVHLLCTALHICTDHGPIFSSATVSLIIFSLVLSSCVVLCRLTLFLNFHSSLLAFDDEQFNQLDRTMSYLDLRSRPTPTSQLPSVRFPFRIVSLWCEFGLV